MKLILLTILFSCCTLFGLWMDGDDRKRLKELENFIYVFEMLKGEIDYQRTPLKEACKGVAAYGKYKVGDVFLNFAAALAQQEETQLHAMWVKALTSQKSNLHLKEEDYKILESFGGSDGYRDKQMQERNLELILEKLEHERKLSEEKYERCGKLTRCIGMLVGIALVIFLM